jgi:RNA polymerase sigma factor (sigma-70 family)
MLGMRKLTNEMVVAAADGSGEALARILRAVPSWVRCDLRRLAENDNALYGEMEDFTQEVLLAVAKGVKRLERPTVSGMRSYVGGIVRRKWPTWSNGRRPRLSIDLPAGPGSSCPPLRDALPVSDTSPTSAVRRAEKVARIQSEMEQLSLNERAALKLRYNKGMRIAEIANRLGRSPEAVAMLIVRARRKLRERLTSIRGNESSSDALA